MALFIVRAKLSRPEDKNSAGRNAVILDSVDGPTAIGVAQNFSKLLPTAPGGTRVASTWEAIALTSVLVASPGGWIEGGTVILPGERFRGG